VLTPKEENEKCHRKENILKIDNEFKKLIDSPSNEELEGLEKKILKEGFREPLMVWQETDILLDGHNRLGICNKNSLEYTTEEISLPDRIAAINWIINNQLSKRNLSLNQISYLRGKRYNLEKQSHGGDRKSEEVKSRAHYEPLIKTGEKSESSPHNDDLIKTSEKIAQETNVSRPTIERDAKYADAIDKIAEVVPDKIETIKALPKVDAVFLANKAPEEQTKIIETIVNNPQQTVKKAIQGIKQQEKEADYRQRVEEIKRKDIVAELPDLLLVDPPWKYDFTETNNRKIENQYQTLSVIEMKDHLPETKKDCLMFMWATAPKLKEAFELIDLWGYSYKTHAIWDKQMIGSGYWFRGQHELLLVATKGNVSPPIVENRVSSVFEEKRTKHSKKPECVYEWIEKAFGDKIKLEMYARERRSGWLSLGDEVE